MPPTMTASSGAPPTHQRLAAQAQALLLDWRVLVCPSDRFGVAGFFADDANPKRSFLINGFNDHFKRTLSDKEYQQFRNWQWPYG